MNPEALRSLLQAVHSGELDIDAALARLKRLPFEDLDFAKIDHHRHLRCGFPEVIYCEGKSPEQVAAIFARLIERDAPVLGTRASEAAYEAARKVSPDVLRYNPVARCIIHHPEPQADTDRKVAVVSAGTADQAVAQEAVETIKILDQSVEAYSDVGVAGLHRLLAHLEPLQSAGAIVVVAGMEGALASVVGGLVEVPVIAVPTSVGYGAHFGGLAPLLGMLNSCASNVAVVNIDNGFGAGFMAALINRRTRSDV
jgi:hypothetical protein